MNDPFYRYLSRSGYLNFINAITQQLVRIASTILKRPPIFAANI